MARKKKVEADSTFENTEQKKSEGKKMDQEEMESATPKESSPKTTNDGTDQPKAEGQNDQPDTLEVEGSNDAAGNDALKGYASKLEEISTEYYNKLHDAAEQLSGYATELYDAGKGYVKTYPTSTILGAFGVGVLIGLLIGRK